jgi:hypothetical protein
MALETPRLAGCNKVTAYMASLDHPLKAEMEAVRAIILSVHPGIEEDVRWGAPSFRYVEHMATFNHRATRYVHLVFHSGIIIGDTTGLLQGDYRDRRMAYFHSMEDIMAKEFALIRAVRTWISIMDSK